LDMKHGVEAKNYEEVCFCFSHALHELIFICYFI